MMLVEKKPFTCNIFILKACFKSRINKVSFILQCISDFWVVKWDHFEIFFTARKSQNIHCRIKETLLNRNIEENKIEGC